jgi:hypothetical protein
MREQPALRAANSLRSASNRIAAALKEALALLLRKVKLGGAVPLAH